MPFQKKKRLLIFHFQSWKWSPLALKTTISKCALCMVKMKALIWMLRFGVYLAFQIIYFHFVLRYFCVNFLFVPLLYSAYKNQVNHQNVYLQEFLTVIKVCSYLSFIKLIKAFQLLFKIKPSHISLFYSYVILWGD